MKALRKDPQERYATIEEFADDLKNFLNYRPILARKGDRWYRLRKFSRRYWLPVAAAAFAAGGLAAGILMASHERSTAQRFDQMRQANPAPVLELGKEGVRIDL
jgi:serine/threonine-protein kinase